MSWHNLDIAILTTNGANSYRDGPSAIVCKLTCSARPVYAADAMQNTGHFPGSCRSSWSVEFGNGHLRRRTQQSIPFVSASVRCQGRSQKKSSAALQP
jgi:hypothetical protein